MSLEMQNEMELVMEPMLVEPTINMVSEKKVSKSLTMNEKRSMYGILSFLVIVNRDGLLDDVKTQELMEHLPIFGTVAEKKVYLSQEMFDMKQIESDILKPMLLEHKQKKKQENKKGKASVKTEKDKKEPKEKRVSKKKEEVKGTTEEKKEPELELKQKEEVKEKKKRVSKKKEEVKGMTEEKKELELEPELKQKEEVKEKKKRESKKKEEVKGMTEEKKELELEPEKKEEVKEKKKRESKKKEEVKETKKRGRKSKEQIVECKVDVNVNEGNSQEDQLAELVNQIADVSKLELTNPQDIDMDDLENVLSNMDEEEEETKQLPETPRLSVPVPVPVPKKRASKKNKE